MGKGVWTQTWIRLRLAIIDGPPSMQLQYNASH